MNRNAALHAATRRGSCSMRRVRWRWGSAPWPGADPHRQPATAHKHATAHRIATCCTVVTCCAVCNTSCTAVHDRVPHCNLLHCCNVLCRGAKRRVQLCKTGGSPCRVKPWLSPLGATAQRLVRKPHRRSASVAHTDIRVSDADATMISTGLISIFIRRAAGSSHRTRAPPRHHRELPSALGPCRSAETSQATAAQTTVEPSSLHRARKAKSLAWTSASPRAELSASALRGLRPRRPSWHSQ